MIEPGATITRSGRDEYVVRRVDGNEVTCWGGPKPRGTQAPRVGMRTFRVDEVREIPRS